MPYDLPQNIYPNSLCACCANHIPLDTLTRFPDCDHAFHGRCLDHWSDRACGGHRRCPLHWTALRSLANHAESGKVGTQDVKKLQTANSNVKAPGKKIVGWLKWSTRGSA
ncbi:hypothetical protein K491DRAFT_688804 [Lophiostoma macrostomum CBS 122681]|uniref:RING-type domain-containing protein n=1 Tax=Lophiostoma macrostomum CBS 122681 TaxID=1314788 RepID=A0A6A6TIU1_9PLEO|nr:hypothetical protein K491DRAFT_688804 [Lophiostoma macrostomum CBS 122681]